jgi:para-aminobenzoate synthetase component 1
MLASSVMTTAQPPLPVVRSLPPGFSLCEAFRRLSTLPGCLWLDSASQGSADAEANEIGRYSFLTADPVDMLVASVQDCDPWPTLDAWCRRLPRDVDASLPPFQGGIAGLIGYEAANWLEPIGPAGHDDLPTPAISLGLYDWTIATDHVRNQSWLISQGIISQGIGASPNDRYQVACQRVDQVEAMLSGSNCRPPSDARRNGQACDASITADQYPTDHHDLLSNFSSQQYRDSVSEIVRLIRDGDSFQVNLAQRLLKKANLTSPDLYLRLRAANPAPFAAYYSGANFEVLSSSPERFLKVRGGDVETRPIKGTVHRTGDRWEDERLAAELSGSEKDRAENVMIVDLMRNDLSRVCTDDSVKVSQLCQIERYEYVQHLVSVVQGQLCQGKTAADLLRACFPGGSVTGAPKIEAMRTIAALEPNPRGPYCGSIGYISCGGSADFSILIRTITAAHGYWQIPVGGGITARSQPAAEEAETWAKAEGMLRAIGDD